MADKKSILNKVLLGVVVLVAIINTVQITRLKDQVVELKTQINSEASKDDSSNVINKSIETMETIETPYCTLRYPAEYYQFLELTENKSEDLYSQVYYCTFNGMKTELFSLFFGAVDSYSQLGYIVHNGEAIPVSINSNRIERNASWSEEEYYTVCVMQESVNDIIQSIAMNEAFVEHINE